MTVLNEIDRFHLALDVIARLPRLAEAGAAATRFLLERLAAHHAYVRATGDDLPEVRDWRWPGSTGRADTGRADTG